MVKGIIFIGGGSGSGKTTVSAQVQKKFGEKAVVLSMDGYYKERKPNVTVEEHDKQTNYDIPEAFDMVRLKRELQELIEGKTVKHDIYSFVTKLYDTHRIINPTNIDVIIIEGIFALVAAQALTFPNVLMVNISPESFPTILKRRYDRDNAGGRSDLSAYARKVYLRVLNGFFEHVVPAAKDAHLELINYGPKAGETMEGICAGLADQIYDEAVRRFVPQTPELELESIAGPSGLN